MPSLVEQGSTPIFDGEFQQSDGTPIDAPDAKVSIVDATGTTVVNLATPTHVSTGHYQYAYIVAADAPTGAWEIRWFGTVDGDALTVSEGFTVVRVGALAVPASGSSVCQAWATSEDATGPCADLDPDVLDEAMLVASDVLWNLTGRKWGGVCTETIRPQAQWRKYDGPARWWPAVASGSAAPWGWCSCHRGRETGCAGVPEIRLPGAPVVADSIVVKIDGAEFFDFRLDDHRFLVRTDGQGWPCCQNLLELDTEEHTWSVTYDFGARPPIGGRRSAASLGCELALLRSDDPSRCRIPKNATSITRQGVGLKLKDVDSLFKDGVTGLPEVDLWVSSERQGVKRQRMTVMIPGRWRSSRRVGR